MGHRLERRPFTAGGAHHVFNRGVDRQELFRREGDFHAFLASFARFLAPDPTHDHRRRPIRKLTGSVDIATYCLMPNHFHLLLIEHERHGISRLMSKAMISYSRYFNGRYNRIGPLCQGRFKSRPINDEFDLMNLTAYIHLNHDEGVDYRHTGHGYLVGKRSSTWIDSSQIRGAFTSIEHYEKFIALTTAARLRVNAPVK